MFYHGLFTRRGGYGGRERRAERGYDGYAKVPVGLRYGGSKAGIEGCSRCEKRSRRSRYWAVYRWYRERMKRAILPPYGRAFSTCEASCEPVSMVIRVEPQGQGTTVSLGWDEASTFTLRCDRCRPIERLLKADFEDWTRLVAEAFHTVGPQVALEGLRDIRGDVECELHDT